MTVEMAWGEDISVVMESGVPVDGFTIGSATLGVIGEDFIGGTFLVDVTEFVTDISTSRGRTDQLQQFNAGSIAITLNNSDRRFDPTNTDSPYYNPITGRFTLTPRKRVFIYSNGEPLFTGSITDLNIEYKPQSVTASTDISTVTVSASDDFVLLANTSIYPQYDPVQTTSGFRLFDVLGLPSVDFPPANYDSSLIFIGVAALGGTEFDAGFAVSAGTNALQYVQKINEAEQGYLFMNAAGQLTFIERLEPQFQTSVAEFSDTGSDIPYNTLSVMFGQEQLYNDITITNVTGTEFSLTDSTSIAEYGLSTFDLTDTLLADSGGTEQLDLLAQNLLLRYKQPAYRFDKMTVTYNGLSSAKQLSLSQLELADVISITRTYPVGTPASVTQQYSVESLRHMITPSSHRLEIGLAVAPLAFPLILDDLVFGTLSETNALS
jgi:hypothetical protein